MLIIHEQQIAAKMKVIRGLPLVVYRSQRLCFDFLISKVEPCSFDVDGGWYQ